MCLVLTKTEYQNAVYDFKMNQKTKRFNFLQTVEFLVKNWSYAKTVEFNNILHDSICSYGEGKAHIESKAVVIYDIGDPCNKVFILKSGKVSVESFIEIDSQNTYPIVNSSV